MYFLMYFLLMKWVNEWTNVKKNTSFSQIWGICHLLPFVRVGQNSRWNRQKQNPTYFLNFLPMLQTCLDFTCTMYMGQNFERCTIGHFSIHEHFYYTWFAPRYSETISFGVVVKSTNRAFRKHILYIPSLIFVQDTGLQMPRRMTEEVMFLHFFIFSEPSCKFSSYITDII